MCSGKEYQLIRYNGQTKQFEMLVTMVPNIKKEHLPSVMMGGTSNFARDALTEESFQLNGAIL